MILRNATMTSTEAHFRDLFNSMEALVDDHVGIIRGVSEVLNEAGAPAFFHYAAEACNAGAFNPRRNFPEGGGASPDRRIAMAKAIGEAVERYCSAFYVEEECTLETADSAPFQVIDPHNFALFSSAQYAQQGFKYVPFTRATLIRWTNAYDIATQETLFIPASMVFVPYCFDNAAGEQQITQPISTGLACHGTWASAAISAICEVIERDAFTIAWQAMMPAPPIRLESLSERNRDLIERFEQVGDSVRVLNLTLDHGVPCILAILAAARSQSPALVFAAASALSAEEAVRKSLEELAHTRRYASRLKSNLGPLIPEPHYANITDQATHVRFYADKARHELAHFLFLSEAWTDFQELPDLSGDCPEEGLRNLTKSIRAINYRILVKDVTTPDIREQGLFVLRAVIPGFHPLFMGHGNRALGGIRLWTVPQTLGYRGITSGDNPAPHPFP